MRRYTGLGFDPAPGSVDQVRAVADTLITAAQHADDTENRIISAVQTSEAWQGSAADEFRHRIGPLVGRVRGQREIMVTAAEVLFSWAGVLGDLQSRAEFYDRQARQLNGRISTAAQLVEEWAIAVSVAGTQTRSQAQATLESYASELGRLRTELGSVLNAAQQLAMEYRQAADDTADRLGTVLGDSPTLSRDHRQPGLTASIGRVLNGLADCARRASLAAALVPATRGAVAPVVSGGLTAVERAMVKPSPEVGRSWTFGDAGVPIDHLLVAVSGDGGERLRDEFRES